MGSMDSSAVVHCQRPSTRDPVVAREWGDLPSELLPSIADRLGLIELLGFRGVCKEWNSASSTASAEIEASPDREPWFLIYGENDNSQCTLVTGSGRQYSITIPEMDGATCLASSQGWLLLFREGSMFFFCPFSRAKIELPVPCELAHREFSDDVAMFSAPPTSKDCVVCIACRTKQREGLELYMIHRGANSWTKHKLESFPNKIVYAAYHNGVFYYFDNTCLMVYFSIEDRRLASGKVTYATSKKDRCLPFRFSSNHEKKDRKKRLALVLGEEESLVSTCGRGYLGTLLMMIPYENTGQAQVPGTHKGVWLQPRFHHIDENQSW
ncbi:NAD(P)-binding Rossmann-fold superfamily protein, putative isoform 1 [Hibiscus syriacus]|uniref:NAD(P)-binding Rossmann-fold superfamily protein, putative isoform 1 n=1 Tax=Hibiscus syriacus TaxID=106335 RepID=A0A6A2Z2G7_HIBSY|nr:F-box protein At3g56470-like [Hibiscus syriacus]KAE8686131.1 NAD(P)-binding Rossmann-fold superfamily protein, putative isoform 1 [Hibiscus syriacus]